MTAAYNRGQTHKGLQTVHQYVKGEARNSSSGFSSVGSSVRETREPKASVDEVEPLLTK